MTEERTSKPTLKGGLKKGYRESREMSSMPRGKIIILVILGSMLWLLFLAPAAWMKLEEVFPKTGIGFFVGLAMYFSWFLFLFILADIKGSHNGFRTIYSRIKGSSEKRETSKGQPKIRPCT